MFNLLQGRRDVVSAKPNVHETTVKNMFVFLLAVPLQTSLQQPGAICAFTGRALIKMNDSCLVSWWTS